MKKNFLFAALAFFAAGCASFAPTSVKTPEMKWTSITLHQSGGIMGLSRSIQIASNGTFTAGDERAEKKTAGVLSAAELFDLNQMVAALKDSSNPSSGMGCADCFIYDLDIQGKEKGVRVLLNDVSLPGSGFESLMDFLRGALDKALQ